MQAPMLKEPKTSSLEVRVGSKSGTFPVSSTINNQANSDIRMNIPITVAGGDLIRPRMASTDFMSMNSGGVTSMTSIRDSREREKNEMCDLNDRFANYIERVRFLDAQNRKMEKDLVIVKARMGKETASTKTMFEAEIAEAKKVCATTDRERAELEKELETLGKDISQFLKKTEELDKEHEEDRQKIGNLLKDYSVVESELNLLRRRVAESEGDVMTLRKLNQTYSSLLSKTASDIDQESMNDIDEQSKVKMLLDELSFIRKEQEQELDDLHALTVRDTTPENQEYFKTELAEAIRSVRYEYDQLMATNRGDIKSRYSLKVQELAKRKNRQEIEHVYCAEESKRLRNQLGDLRSRLTRLEGKNSIFENQVVDLNSQLEDCQRNYHSSLLEREESIRKTREQTNALLLELQNLSDTKKTLEEEISMYRELLEGEESRSGLRRLVQTTTPLSSKTPSRISSITVKETKLEADKNFITPTKKVQYEGLQKSTLAIQEADTRGVFVVIENTSFTENQNLGEWTLKRIIEGNKDIVYTFPKDFILPAKKSVKIWAKDQGGTNNPPSDLIFESSPSFGLGKHVRTVLLNTDDQEMASHIQDVKGFA